MPNIKSAKKRSRQNVKRRAHNKAQKSMTKTAQKKLSQYITEGNAEKAQEVLSETISTLDKAAQKHVYHKNYVARQKSRLQKKLAALQKAE